MTWGSRPWHLTAHWKHTDRYRGSTPSLRKRCATLGGGNKGIRSTQSSPAHDGGQTVLDRNLLRRGRLGCDRDPRRTVIRAPLDHPRHSYQRERYAKGLA